MTQIHGTVVRHSHRQRARLERVILVLHGPMKNCLALEALSFIRYYKVGGQSYDICGYEH